MKWPASKILLLAAAVLFAIGSIVAGTSLNWAPVDTWLLGGLCAAALSLVA